MVGPAPLSDPERLEERMRTMQKLLAQATAELQLAMHELLGQIDQSDPPDKQE